MLEEGRWLASGQHRSEGAEEVDDDEGLGGAAGVLVQLRHRLGEQQVVVHHGEVQRLVALSVGEGARQQWGAADRMQVRHRYLCHAQPADPPQI